MKQTTMLCVEMHTVEEDGTTKRRCLMGIEGWRHTPGGVPGQVDYWFYNSPEILTSPPDAETWVMEFDLTEGIASGQISEDHLTQIGGVWQDTDG